MAFRAKAELGHFGVAAILIAGTLPMLVLAPFSGLLVDRVRTRPLLVTVTLVQAGAVRRARVDARRRCSCRSSRCSPAAPSSSSPAWQALVPTLVTESPAPRRDGPAPERHGDRGGRRPVRRRAPRRDLRVPRPAPRRRGVVRASSRRSPSSCASTACRRAAAEGGISMTEAFAGVRLAFSNQVLRSLLVLATLFVLAVGRDQRRRDLLRVHLAARRAARLRAARGLRRRRDAARRASSRAGSRSASRAPSGSSSPARRRCASGSSPSG